MKKVLSQVLGRIKLSREEVADLEETAREFISKLNKQGIRAYVGGSLAKGTIAKTSGKQDIDIFAVFKTKSELSGFEGKLKKIK